jgi:glycosyltransferase involved in cell wall biosynthesis
MENSKTIGIFHYQVGETDGVSLEIEKWKTVLERMGHRVLLCAGHLGNQNGILIPELYHHNPEIAAISRQFINGNKEIKPHTINRLLTAYTQTLKESLKRIILENRIDLLLVNNVWSVALNLPATIALEEVRREFDLPAIAHHHDFYWERANRSEMTYPTIGTILDQYLPPNDPKIKHVVINSIAQSSLRDFKGIYAKVIPNVFDFKETEWGIDDYNSDLRRAIGLHDNDICVLQATRIIPRKGIELAIELVSVLNESQHREELIKRGLYNGQIFNQDSKIVLVLAGYDRDDPTGVYLQNLKEKAKVLGVDMRHIKEIIGPERIHKGGSKIYSLWDAYTIADLVTYPSLWEGWGNQLLEALRAKLPIVSFEYPVYLQDIKNKGIDIISLGSEIVNRDEYDHVQISEGVLQRAAEQCVDYLTNRRLREDMINKNFQIAKQYYGFDRLENDLAKLL